MTKRHFIQMATVLREAYESNFDQFRRGMMSDAELTHANWAVTQVRQGFINMAKADNPRFAEAQFIMATNPTNA